MSRKYRYLISLLVIILAAAGTAPADLIAWWQMDETAGNVVSDASGNGIDGVLEGGAAVVNDAERGLVFQQNDVATNYISIADPGGLLNFSSTGPHQGSATIAAWVKSNGDWTNHDAIFSQGEWDDGISLSIKGDTSPAGQLWLAGDGTHAVTFRSDVAVPTDGWHHVAATFAYDGATTVVAFYLDGEPTGFSQGNGNIPGQVSAPVGGISRIGLEDRGSAPRWPFNGSIDDVMVFDTALSQEEIQDAMAGKGGNPELASNLFPDDQVEDIPLDVILSWSHGEFASTHDVYFGTSFEDVNNASRNMPLGVLVRQGQDANSFDPAGLLDLNQIYYWRIDEVNATADHTIFKGPVLSFTTEPVAYPISNITVTASSEGALSPAVNVINGSGLTDGSHGVDGGTMWLSDLNGAQPTWIQFQFDRAYQLHEITLWNQNQSVESAVGFGIKDAFIETSLDGDQWTALGDNAGQFVLSRGPGLPGYNTPDVISAANVVAQYVRITAQSNHGGFFPQFGLSEVQFSFIPAQAREPKPAVEAIVQSLSPTLSWRVGRGAVSHEVYFSSDMAAVLDNSALADVVNTNSYALSGLDYGTTYYWKVNEINDAAVLPMIEGDLWRFTVSSTMTIDDFEGYTNDSPNRPFQTWIDGLGFSNPAPGNPGNGSGAVVGHDIFSAGTQFTNLMEKSIILSGQSMPFYYNNTGSTGKALYSQIDRTFSPAQDWTVGGLDTLIVNYYAPPISFLETTPGSFIVSGAGADIWNTADEFRYVWKQLSGNGSITTRVESLENTNAWARAGVMVRDTLDAGSTFAAVYSTAANGVRFQARLITDVAATSDTPIATEDQIAQVQPVWIRIERTGFELNGFYSQDGQNWTTMVWNPQTISMADPVYIGLAVNSHNAGTYTMAEYSNVSTTGNVTGDWQSTAVGVAQPGNQPESLYVTVNGTTVTNPDPNALITGQWESWEVSLSSFGNVNAVTKISVGVGDPDNPQAGGEGMILIDDLQVGKTGP